jgi:hypothetical protein
MKEPEIVIVIEGGTVINVATAGSGITYRIIDIDLIKVGDNEPAYTDNVRDVEDADIDRFTKDILKDVEVIAESVPDDAVMGIRDMPAPKPVLRDEGELSDIILSNIHLLTCFNCGKALKDVPSRHRVGVEEGGVLCIDPGRINYPREPLMSRHRRTLSVWIAGDLRVVISARHLLATRANLRIAHERHQEKALWEEEHGSCRKCEYENNSDPHARCNGCINGGGKSDLYKRRQKKRKPVPKMVMYERLPKKFTGKIFWS